MRDLGHAWRQVQRSRGSERGWSGGRLDRNSTGGATHAFLWEHGRMIELGALSTGRDSAPVAINERGQVVGKSRASDRRSDERVPVAAGKLIYLTSAGASSAEAISERGKVLGFADGRVFSWRGGKLYDEGALPRDAVARRINLKGQVAYPDLKGDRAFLWDHGRRRDLGRWEGAAATHARSPNAVQIFGDSTTASGARHTFIWANGTMRDLGTLGGATRGSSLSTSAARSSAGARRRQGATCVPLADGQDDRPRHAAGRTSKHATALNRPRPNRRWVTTKTGETPRRPLDAPQRLTAR